MTVSEEDGSIKLIVENDGTDMQKTASGIGMRTTAERVRSMKGDIQTTVTAGGIYRVEVTL